MILFDDNSFNFYFANETILSYFFFFFLILDLHFLIPVILGQIFNPIAELVIPIGIPIKNSKAEMEAHPVTVEIRIRKVQYNLELHKPFCASYSSVHFALFPRGNNFLFHLFFNLSF